MSYQGLEGLDQQSHLVLHLQDGTSRRVDCRIADQDVDVLPAKLL